MDEAESLAKLMYAEYSHRQDILEPLQATIENGRGDVITVDRLKLRPKWSLLTSVEQALWYHIASAVLLQYEHKPVLKLRYDDEGYT